MQTKPMLLVFSLLCCALFGQASFGQDTRSQLLDTAIECARLTDSLLRLRCYDDLFMAEKVPSPSGALVVEPSQVVEQAPAVKQPNPVEPWADTAEDRFGSERVLEAKTRRESPKNITSTIVKLRKKLRGEYVFELANGQIWHQVETDRTRFRSNVAVEIFKSSFASYTLDAKGIGRTKVKRVK